MRTASIPAAGGRKLLQRCVMAFLAMVSAAVMLFAIPPASAAFKYVQKGSDVPDFNLTATDGQQANLASLKEGKAAVILFWATWSPRSLDEMKVLQGLYEKHKDKGLRVLGINVNHLTFSMEDQKAVEKAVAETGVTFPIALDKGLETYNNFGVVATPSTLVMTSAGQVAWEISSFLTFTGEQLTENVEIALGVRAEPSGEAVAEAKETYKPARKAMLYFNLGRNLLKMGSRDKAMEKLEQAASEDPKYAAPRVILGHLHLDRASGDPGSLESALKLFTEAVAADPRNVSALSGLGEALYRSGKLDDAEGKFKEASSLDPTFTPAITGLASVLAGKGQHQEAMGKFKEALELNPLNPDVYSRRAGSFEAQGKLKEAAQDLRRAVEILLGYGLEKSEV